MVFAAVLAARCGALVLPRHTLSPKLERGAPSTRLLAQVDEELQETVEKSGVEGGLFSIFTGDGDAKEKATTAGDLLKQYGGAYLLTSSKTKPAYASSSSAASPSPFPNIFATTGVSATVGGNLMGDAALCAA